MIHTSSDTRRGFIRKTAAVTSGIFVPNILIGQEGGGKKINVAGIGCGGKGATDIAGASEGASIVALCDPDRDCLADALKRYPDAKGFECFREMFEAMGDKIDMVTVSTPDHAHYPAAMEAIKRGKHVCVQKPLVNRIWEANQLYLAAKKKGVKTNMGNQGHTGEGIRLLKEWVNAGMIGNVQEIHVWTNRPIWPQGLEAQNKIQLGPPAMIIIKSRVKDEPDIQKALDLNWTSWLAATPEVPFLNGLHPFTWRGHREYGAGAMGDMGCHILDGPFWSAELGEPYKMEAECDELTETTWPKSSHVIFYFKSAKFGEVKLHWYEGGRMPERPADLEATRDWDKMKGGFLMKGDAGEILNTDDYCSSPRMIPEDKFKAFLTDKKPAKTLERSLAAGNPQHELVKAIELDKICGSNFDYSVPLTKLCLLGNLAIANHGKVIEWDSAAQNVKGDPEASKFIKRAAYRPGFEYSADKI